MGEVEADDWNPEIKKDKAATSQRDGRVESKGRTRQRLTEKEDLLPAFSSRFNFIFHL